jgi:hypothetical protein
MNPAWYIRRLQRMSPSEVAGRINDQAMRILWRFRPPDVAARAHGGLLKSPRQPGLKVLPRSSEAPAGAKQRLIEQADEILRSHWRIFTHSHLGFGQNPDWFVDARSGRRAPSGVYAFSIPYRDEARIGNIKYIWEPSRHHHLTILAAAYYLTADDRYAKRIADHLQSWWRENPFLKGPHWISGIEIGLRLISWAWTRQLLESWPGAAALFEDNDDFITQLYAHQFWLSRFPSRGSSANNHIIAEAAGQFVGSCVFPLFRESESWRAGAARTLGREATAQTFACGSNRELATDYHGFVLELLLAAAVQGEAAGHPLDVRVWDTTCRMTDAIAAMLDQAGHAPRQGDADDGVGLLVDGHGTNRWLGLLATGARLFSPLQWWPEIGDADLRTFLWADSAKLSGGAPARPDRKPRLLLEAGQTFLTSAEGAVWCRCDHGPHGFGSIAAHAHADALSVECRIGGIEILADPGTYCYHGDPKWRAYFRSTFAHNTLRLFARDQSLSGGPFLWTRHAQSFLISASGLDDADDEASWIAEHTGYAGAGGLVHRRSVTLMRRAGKLIVRDTVRGEADVPVPASLCWHLGPSVSCMLDGKIARLSWPGGRAELDLADELSWTAHRGDEALPAGWYSPCFDRKVPATTLVGSGSIAPGTELVTEVQWLVSGARER